MYQYVALTDGVTTVVLNDGISYALTSYAPGVPYVNDNALGPLYADVVDTITFDAIGCTAAEAYSAAAAVNALLDQARRWWDGETVSAVRLQIEAQESALALPLEACLKGRAPGGAAPLSLPAQWSAFYGKYLVQGITIQFVRRGQLLYPTAETATSSQQTTPNVQAVAISTPTDISSPTKLSYSFFNGGVAANGVIEQAVVLTASAANRLQIYEAESTVKGSNVATQADAANLARGGSVARYSPGVLSTQMTQTFSGLDSNARKIAVWAAVRNNSLTTTFTIQIQDVDTLQTAPPVAIDTSSQRPRIVFLGILANRFTFNGIKLLLTASAAADTLDVDYFVVQAVDDETSGALAILTTGAVAGQVGFAPLVIDPQILSQPQPIVYSGSGTIRALNYAGDPTFYTPGAFVATILAPAGNPATFWRVVNSGGTALDSAVTASRYGAYLVPV